MKNYYAFINGEVEGPFAMEAMIRLEDQGRIIPKTQIKADGDSEWTSWGSIYKAAAPVATPVPRRVTRDPQLVALDAKAAIANRRRQLRAETHYPVLRHVCVAVAILNCAAAVFFLFLGLGGAQIYFVACAASLLSIVPISFGLVLIDIADASLRRPQEE